MDLSLIIATWNNSRRLARALEAISRCLLPRALRWELLLVNNNCADDTDAVARGFLKKLPLVLLHEPVQGVSRAKNVGLKAAAGSLILFTDDDVEPSTEWIAAHWSAFEAKPSGFYFGGPIESVFEGAAPPEELLKARMTPLSVKGLDWGSRPRPLGDGEFFIGPNFSCPRAGLEMVGGFDPRLGQDPSLGKARAGEESDLMRRLQKRGWSPWYLPEARVRHLIPEAKCRLEHVGARVEASAFYLASEVSRPLRGPVVAGVPWVLLKELAAVSLRWLWNRLRGRKAYDEYLRLRAGWGTLGGLRRRARGRAPLTDGLP